MSDDDDYYYSYMECMVTDNWRDFVPQLPDPILRDLSIVLGVAYVMLLGLMIYSLKMTWTQYKLITRKNNDDAYDKTYCLTSKWLVQIIAVGTPVCILTLILHAVQFFDTYDWDGCFTVSDKDFPQYMVIPLALCLCFCDLIIFGQSFEWYLVQNLFKF
jgi:hypothetical protein